MPTIILPVPDTAVASITNCVVTQGHGFVSDGELLCRFVKARDQAAFAELVNRFGPLVIGIAVRTLRDKHAAEDVFQATFLILARDARKIRKPAAVGAWIHGVTLKVSRKLLKRRQRERSLELPMQIADEDTLFLQLNEQFEHQSLDEELKRLPEFFRAPLVLHFLEGKTCEETAAALGITVGAVRGRLQRGKRELKLRLMRRGVELSAVVTGLTLWQSVAEAAVHADLLSVTIQGGMATVQGTPFSPETSPEAVQLAIKDVSMFTKAKVLTACTVLASTTALGWFAHAESSRFAASLAQPRIATDVSSPLTVAASQLTIVKTEFTETALARAQETADSAGEKPGKPELILKYGDGKADGKKSIAGTGEMIQFSLPDTSQKLRSIKIHCARYGTPQAPDEDAEISIVSEDTTELLHTELVPYSKFRRGESTWITIGFEDAIEVSDKFWVILNFDAQRTKGVYVSYDSSTQGHSKTGLPGGTARDVDFEGDWMVQAVLTKPE